MTTLHARFIALGSLSLIIGVATACPSAGPTAPPDPLSVRLTGPSVVQGHDTTVDGTPSYVCYYRLTATAVGGLPGDAANWSEGHFTYQGQSSADSGRIPSAAALFSPYTSVPVGGQLSAAEHDVWTQPFQATIVLYYVTTYASVVDSATYTYMCQ